MTPARKRYIGASEVAALFDAHPYMTHFQLWHIKAGNLQKPKFADTENSFWGDVLEPKIAEGFCRLYGFDLIELDRDQRFTVHPTIRQCCANLDYKIRSHDAGEVRLLECKQSDFIQFRDTFPEGRVPLKYELQLQQEMMCSGEARADLAVLVGGNTMHRYERTPRPAIVQIIAEAIEEFWQSIDAGTPPKPDYARDGAHLAALIKMQDGTSKDFRGNNYLNNLCGEYLQWSKKEAEAKKAKEAIRAELLDMTGKSVRGYTDSFEVSVSIVQEADISYTRKAYPNLTIKERK